MGWGLFVGDTTVHLLSTLGIVSLFLFAGLEVDFDDLRRGARVLSQHLVLRMLTLAGVGVAVGFLLDLDARPAALVALALLTPSTGFILDSLPSFGLGKEERFWVKSKAIAAELLALGTLFVALQSTSALRLAGAAAALVALIAALPVLFRVFAVRIAPYAPKSEFAFLLMLATVAAFVTRKLGVYYLVGAFLVGVAAQRFRERLPAMASEKMLHAVEVFASFFVPFYFFNAGAHLRREDFGVGAFLAGGAFLLVTLPLKVGLTVAHRRVALGEAPDRSVRVALSLVPTLVFTLVLSEILRDRFEIPPYLFGGLVIYTIANTLIPGLVLRVPAPELDVTRGDDSEVPPSAVRDDGKGATTDAPTASSRAGGA